jgi:hypothetical protein
MIRDTFNTFSTSGDFANEAGTANVGDIIDLGLDGRDIGNGEPLYLVIVVETAADGGAGAAGTTQFRLVSDATSTISTTTATVHFDSQAFLAATDLTQGRILVFPLPIGGGAHPYERYLGLQIVQAVEGEDDLVCSAFLTRDPTGWKAYADANN